MSEFISLANDLGDDVFRLSIYLFLAVGFARGGITAIAQMIGVPMAVKNYMKDIFIAALCILGASVIFKALNLILMARVSSVFKVLQ